MIIPRFLNPTNSFHAELRKRINDYFVEIKAKPTGNFKLYSKAIILISSFIAVYVHLIFFTSDIIYVSLFECLLLGTLTSAIGFNIMHDGAHGSFSQQKWLNELAGLFLVPMCSCGRPNTMLFTILSLISKAWTMTSTLSHS